MSNQTKGVDGVVTLKTCPCGVSPNSLHIIEGDAGGKWGYASGGCCNDWSIEFRNDYSDIGSNESKAKAETAWNQTPRATTDTSALDSVRAEVAKKMHEVLLSSDKSKITGLTMAIEIIDAELAGDQPAKGDSDDPANM